MSNKKSFIVETDSEIDAIEIQSMLSSMDIVNKTRLLDKGFNRHLKKLLDCVQPDECRHYEEWHDNGGRDTKQDDVADASKIPLDELDKKHIYYSVRYLREALK
jgi:hypothetical protein